MRMTHLRQAHSLDAGSVGEILSEFIDTTPWMPRIHTRAEDLSFASMMIDRGWVTVAEIYQGVAGFSSLSDGVLHALYVRDTARGQGIGTALLDRCKRDVKDLTLWTFQANTRAQSFYLRHGFQEIERSDGARNDEGLPDVKFQWQEACG
ncbi:MAG: GNAT family N-acetyltransferase [Pseudomonadota bacterium]